MVKVVWAEMLYPEGHRVLNQKYIEILSQSVELIVVDSDNYFSSMQLPSNVTIIYTKRWVPSVNLFLKWKRYLPFIKYDPIALIAHIYNLILIAFKIRKTGYSKIVFSSVRNDALCLSLWLFKKKSVTAFHHYDIDHLSDYPREMRIFRLFMNKLDHIVLADFIKKGWEKQISIHPERVHVVYQPLINKPLNRNQYTKRKPVIIGLGQTLDDSVLEMIIKHDKDNVNKLPYSIILRHKSKKYDGNNVQVIADYLSREEFEEYLNTSAACVLFYPQNYNLRYSGIIDDALSHQLVVYGNDIEVVRYFASKYPSGCKVIKSPLEIFHLSEELNNSMSIHDYSLFVEQHRPSIVLDMFMRALSLK